MTGTSDQVRLASALNPDEIHIWRYCLDTAFDSSVLSPDECARAERLIVPEKRRQFMAGRSRLRQILSQYTDTSAEKLVFQYGAQGKPTVCDLEPLQFNLAHADDFALLAIAWHPVGIDVERIKPLSTMKQMAEIAFSPAEQAMLNHYDPTERTQVFFHTWARKEAFMKGKGEGFKLARTFSLPISGDSQIILVDGWTVHDVAVQTGFIGAVASQQPDIQLRYMD